MYLLDTNIVSELRKPRPHGALVAWLEGIADADLHLCVVTLGEIQAGIELTREQDAAKAAALEFWADQVAATYNVLPMDGTTFRLWAKLMHRQSDCGLRGCHDCGLRHGSQAHGRHTQRPGFSAFRRGAVHSVRELIS